MTDIPTASAHSENPDLASFPCSSFATQQQHLRQAKTKTSLDSYPFPLYNYGAFARWKLRRLRVFVRGIRRGVRGGEGDRGTTETCKAAEKISLPSAADLFDSVGVGSFMSPSGPAIPATDSPATATPKRRKDGGSIHRSSISSSSAKRNKSNAEGEKSGGVSKGLIPPQMSRPNIVTEDSALWSSDASVKRQRQTAAENKRAGGGAGNGKGVDEKGAKGSMTYKQREKAKRDKGQASRGKSYVEEEKRLLRELGSS